jgi:hypothetical protein
MYTCLQHTPSILEYWAIIHFEKNLTINFGKKKYIKIIPLDSYFKKLSNVIIFVAYILYFVNKINGYKFSQNI